MRKYLINIELTPDCPAACSMCPRHVIKDSGFMSLEMMERIVNQVDKSFAWELALAGRGEPTIHPQFEEHLEIMQRSNVPVCVVTTGVTMNDKNLRACEKKVDRIRLSVSSIRKEIFDKVHIGLKHDMIWKNIKNLSTVAADKTTIHLTGGPEIYDGVQDTVEYLRSLGFKSFLLLPRWNRGGSLDTNVEHEKRNWLIKNLNLKSAETEYFNKFGKLLFFSELLIKKALNWSYCPVGDVAFNISYKGDVLGCFQDFGHINNHGHINDFNIKQLIQEQYKRLGKMEICESCDVKRAVDFKGLSSEKNDFYKTDKQSKQMTISSVCGRESQH